MKIDVQETPIAVPGFRFGAAACGIKNSGAPDVAVLVVDRPATAAATFTRNLFRAAPVVVAGERIRPGRLQAIVVNSGNANACTGRNGLADARRACSLAARSLGISADLVAPASTGIIGVPLPMDRLARGIQVACGLASESGLWGFARAIMTSDAHPKVATETVRLGGRRITVAGIAKGAGMIAPDLATLLVFFVTDAALARREARALARAISEQTLNGLSVDGDTSTNDSLFLLAGGAAENAPPAPGSGGLRALERAALAVGGELARLVAADGEGATKVVTIDVENAPSVQAARRVGRSVGESTLVKAAFFGSDPNWGRIACAIGYAGVAVDPDRVTIRIGDAVVFRRGAGVEAGRERARAAMQGQDFRVRIDLGSGRARARFVTSDLTHDYVEFNSAYTT